MLVSVSTSFSWVCVLRNVDLECREYVYYVVFKGEVLLKEVAFSPVPYRSDDNL